MFQISFLLMYSMVQRN